MTDSGRNRIEWNGGTAVQRVLSNGKRRYTAEFKAWVVERCREPGASVAATALANGLNANLVRKWIGKAAPASLVGAGERDGGTRVMSFVPVNVAPDAPSPSEIRIELRRGPISMAVAWPVAAAAECAVWMRELLK